MKSQNVEAQVVVAVYKVAEQPRSAVSHCGLTVRHVSQIVNQVDAPTPAEAGRLESPDVLASFLGEAAPFRALLTARHIDNSDSEQSMCDLLSQSPARESQLTQSHMRVPTS
jgi:hypothetical protein